MRFIESEVIERRNGHTYRRVIEIVYDECAFIYKNGQAHSKIPPATSDICKQCKHRLKHLVGECYNQVTIEALQKEFEYQNVPELGRHACSTIPISSKTIIEYTCKID